jgi:MFS family permease
VSTDGAAGPVAAQGSWTPWRVVVWFGVVSLAADMVYEGARSMYGPLLAALGASATVVGLVTGAGEAMAHVLRLVFGPLADRRAAHWSLTVAGYGLTAVCVPLLALSPRLGAAGLAVACLLILLERTGKAVRSPSKSALLAEAAVQVGRGRGFGIHKALDQVGAFAGPLVVAAVVAASSIWAGMAVLAVPGAVAMLLLAVLRRHVPTMPSHAPPANADSGLRGWLADAVGSHLPREFWRYAVAASLTTGGLVTFGIIGFHLVREGLLATAAVPVAYAGAMLAEAVAALVVGVAYDRVGGRVLLVVPVLVAVVPALALGSGLAAVLVGVAVWGVATGVQDSTIKAVVAEFVDAPRRATAFGVFAAVQGAFAVVGGGLAGWLYDRSLPALVAVTVATQVAAFAVLASTLRGRRRGLPSEA